VRSPVAVGQLTWSEYAERLRQAAAVLLPIGALEQHGQHLPLESDTRITEALAARVATVVGGLVLPPVAYGARSLARSGGGTSFPGTTDLDGTTLIALVRDILREQHRHGARRLVVLLGHGENEAFAVEGAELARRAVGDPVLKILVIGWWHMVPAEALAPLFPEGFPGWDLEHAARVETALMLSLAPELVRADRIGPIDPIVAPPYTVLPTPKGAVPPQGSLADPRGATAKMGQSLVELITKRLAETVERVFEIVRPPT
jgi:creatinine amidohydrolase